MRVAIELEVPRGREKKGERDDYRNRSNVQAEIAGGRHLESWPAAATEAVAPPTTAAPAMDSSGSVQLPARKLVANVRITTTTRSKPQTKLKALFSRKRKRKLALSLSEKMRSNGKMGGKLVAFIIVALAVSSLVGLECEWSLCGRVEARKSSNKSTPILSPASVTIGDHLSPQTQEQQQHPPQPHQQQQKQQLEALSRPPAQKVDELNGSQQRRASAPHTPTGKFTFLTIPTDSTTTRNGDSSECSGDARCKWIWV